MAREVNIELARFRSLAQYKPRIGDFIIKHGLIVSVKWFGVINHIDQNGNLMVASRGHPRILFRMSQEEIPGNITKLTAHEIISARPGSYTVMQQEATTNIPVWYV